MEPNHINNLKTTISDNLDDEINQKYCQKSSCKFLFVYSNSGQEASVTVDFLNTFAHLASKLNRTLVLTNVGQSKIDSCEKFPFEFYYNVEYLRKQFPRLSLISQEKFQDWTIERVEKPNFHYLHLMSSSSLSLFDDKVVIIKDIPLNIRSRNCLKNFPMSHHNTSLEKIIFKSELLLNSFYSKKLSKYLIQNLKSSQSEILLIDNEIRRDKFSKNHLLSTSTYSYSELIYQETWKVKVALGSFIAIYWSMINVTDVNLLSNCAENLVTSLTDLKENFNLNNVYLVTDYPISSDYFKLKSISLRRRSNNHHHRAIDRLDSAMTINTWYSLDAFNTIRQEAGNKEEFKGVGIVNILDKLICTESDYFIIVPPECSSESTNDFIFINEVVSARRKLYDDDQNIISGW